METTVIIQTVLGPLAETDLIPPVAPTGTKLAFINATLWGAGGGGAGIVEPKINEVFGVGGITITVAGKDLSFGGSRGGGGGGGAAIINFQLPPGNYKYEIGHGGAGGTGTSAGHDGEATILTNTDTAFQLIAGGGGGAEEGGGGGGSSGLSSANHQPGYLGVGGEGSSGGEITVKIHIEILGFGISGESNANYAGGKGGKGALSGPDYRVPPGANGAPGGSMVGFVDLPSNDGRNAITSGFFTGGAGGGGGAGPGPLLIEPGGNGGSITGRFSGGIGSQGSFSARSTVGPTRIGGGGGGGAGYNGNGADGGQSAVQGSGAGGGGGGDEGGGSGGAGGIIFEFNYM